MSVQFCEEFKSQHDGRVVAAVSYDASTGSVVLWIEGSDYDHSGPSELYLRPDRMGEFAALIQRVVDQAKQEPAWDPKSVPVTLMED